MESIDVGFDGVKMVEKVPSYPDNRGSFSILHSLSSNERISQVNLSISKAGTIRGLHYQYNPKLSKTVIVMSGSIQDIVVDLRKDSKTYLQHKCFYLSEGWKLVIPYWCAHGFMAYEDETTVLYLYDAPYNKDGEASIYPFDEILNIKWQVNEVDEIIMSDRDKNGIKAEDAILEMA